MRLVVILILGLEVFGPALIHAEKIVFVVPRYIKRSYTPSFYNQGERSLHKIRNPIRGPKRPNFGTGLTSEQFSRNEKHRLLPQGGDDFVQGFSAPRQEVNHVVIPHGKGISHGISFGKGYVPRDEFQGGNENHEFPVGNGNQLDSSSQNHHGGVRFEDEEYLGFQNQGQDFSSRNIDWPFSSPAESGHVPVNYNQATNRDQPGFDNQDMHRSQESSSPSKQESFFPKATESEETQAGLRTDVPPSGVSDAAPMVSAPRISGAPIILQDTIDMRAYLQEMEALARSWPSASGLQGFDWKNQIPNAPGLPTLNYNGFNSWSSNLHRSPSAGYEVEEDTAEEQQR